MTTSRKKNIFFFILTKDMDVSLLSKNKQLNIIFKCFQFTNQSVFFTRTSNKRPSLKFFELIWNLLKRLKEGGS